MLNTPVALILTLTLLPYYPLSLSLSLSGFRKVLSSVYSSVAVAALSVKINCVLMRGTNEMEIGTVLTHTLICSRLVEVEVEVEVHVIDGRQRKGERGNERMRERKVERDILTDRQRYRYGDGWMEG